MRYQPLRYRTIRDILDWTRTFHEVLASEYKNMAQERVRARVSLLLEYLASHEKALELALQHFEEGAHKELLNTWHDHFPELDLPDNLEELRSHLSTVETADVVRLAIKFHEALVCLFEEIRNTASTEEVRDVFDNLVLMENREKERMVRDAAMLEDY